ncbi:MAG: TldD/PmbA family protein [Oscillospiraceae bacterium]|jgi:TldD protein|nr:TldD/PmbA family protein [Oscillospiraceae bacterium]
MQDLLTAYKPKLSGHTELRVQRNMNRNVSLVAGNIVGNSFTEQQGVSARVYDGGYWGFASGADYNERNIDSVLAAAVRNAKFLTSRLGAEKPAINILPSGKFSTKVTRDNDVTQKTLIDFAREIDAYIVAKYPKLASRVVSTRSDATEKYLVTSDGADVYSLMPRSATVIQLSAETDDGAVVEIYDYLAGDAGFFSEVCTDPKLLFGKIDALYELIMRKREGVYADAGVRDVILDSKLAGILAHEAIGHTTEADLVLGGSVAGPNLGKPVASEIVTLVDFANTALGLDCPQPIFVDDEGTVARDATIIENGVLRGFMHNRETAQRFGHEPTGNARAYLFSDEPLVRMRNTAILPGTDKLADMIASVDDGYYLTHTGNGQADLTSEFMFGVNMGYEIKNGKIGRAIRDTTISGVAFDLLKTVTMLSDEMTWESGGMCGKKQPIAVGMGGPSVKCRVNIGGR